jgi:hypothetical protein
MRVSKPGTLDLVLGDDALTGQRKPREAFAGPDAANSGSIQV